MPKAIIMPKFEMAQESGKVGAWLKQVGAHVEKGDPLVEVETDKITMEVEAPASGTLMVINAQPGEIVPIGTVIAQLLLPGEMIPGEMIPGEMIPGEMMPALPSVEVHTPRLTPVAKRVAATHGVDPQSLPNDGGRVTKATVEQFVHQQINIPVTASSDKIRAVPAARRLARELGVDLAQVPGSGPDGRIQSADVQQAAQAQRTAQPTHAPTLPELPAIRQRVPLTAMRRTIAERLTTSWHDIPQFAISLDVDMTRCQQVLEEVRSVQKDGPRVTLTALLVKACAWALARHPRLNASFEEDALVEWADINIGVAVAVEAGLLVPVIRQAERLSLGAIAGQLQDLGERAHTGKLLPSELRGGTFTLSNLGMLGVEQFTAIINPPQAAILAVGKTVKRFVVTDDDQMAIRPLANLTLTADHRVVDGASAARFLTDLRQALEKPALLL
jgi:pyruvate dehydrogenase E2 component (dihydrolipoamide acetyltransferase)